MMTTASPFAALMPAMTAQPNPCSPSFWMGDNSGMCPRISSRVCHVPSLLPSSTTTISCGTRLSFSSRCKCSTVAAMQPCSLRAGMTTLNRLSGFPGCGGVGVIWGMVIRVWQGPRRARLSRRQGPERCGAGRVLGASGYGRRGGNNRRQRRGGRKGDWPARSRW